MAKKDTYSLVVPLDASGTEGYEPGRTLQVMVVDARGTHHSEKVKLGAKGAGSARFLFGQMPGSLRVLVGAEDASAEELLRMHTLGVDVSLNQWIDTRELTLAPIRFPPYFWATVIRRVVENRSIESSNEARTFVLSRPKHGSVPGLPGSTEDLPLVIVLHPDGSTGAGIRTDLPIESYLPAVYAYPDGTLMSETGRQFDYDTFDGRRKEAQLVTDLIDALHAEFKIKKSRVFVAGVSGGATMANALGCYLGPSVIRGLGIHSGTLYRIDTGKKDVKGNPIYDIDITPTNVVNCPMPDVRIVWGKADDEEFTTYQEDGKDTRNKYRATQKCAGDPTDTNDTTDTTSVSPYPCVAYKVCTRAVEWCPIEGVGHWIWDGDGDPSKGAAGAFATFFGGLS
jgi:poly(3-hydroxybutyrate) depolymerase